MTESWEEAMERLATLERFNPIDEDDLEAIVTIRKHIEQAEQERDEAKELLRDLRVGPGQGGTWRYNIGPASLRNIYTFLNQETKR